MVARAEATEPSPAASLVKIRQAPRGGDLARRLTWLMLGRTLVISVVLGLNIWLLTTGKAPTTGVVWLLSGLVAATYLVTVVSALLLKRGVAAERLVWPQITADLAITAVLVLVT